MTYKRELFTLPDGRVGDRAYCRSCGADVVFAINPKTGRKPPYDLDGVSHFATCPDAPKWKGKARDRGGDR